MCSQDMSARLLSRCGEDRDSKTQPEDMALAEVMRKEPGRNTVGVAKTSPGVTGTAGVVHNASPFQGTYLR